MIGVFFGLVLGEVRVAIASGGLLAAAFILEITRKQVARVLK